jgi:hypothetical protein
MARRIERIHTNWAKVMCLFSHLVRKVWNNQVPWIFDSPNMGQPFHPKAQKGTGPPVALSHDYWQDWVPEDLRLSVSITHKMTVSSGVQWAFLITPLSIRGLLSPWASQTESQKLQIWWRMGSWVTHCWQSYPTTFVMIHAPEASGGILVQIPEDENLCE